MSFFYNLFSKFSSRPDFSKSRDELYNTKIYQSINWNKSVIGGSYALHQFTGATHWKPDDVDIMLACESKEEYESEAMKFEQTAQLRLMKQSWFGDRNEPMAADEELFHERVLGSRTYEMENFNKKIQLVCLMKKYQNETVMDILEETTDIPACVSYKVNLVTGNKMFNVPEKGREILLTGKGKKEDICKSRMEKYLMRGYSFE